ncbi:MAG: MFS transporter [Chloroflexi bacterium]|nr:MFS transporter [Chloroflexota bacterium]
MASNARPAWLIPAHLLGVVLIQGAITAVVFILPVIARKQFGAVPTQVLLITAAPTVLYILSIFWHAWLKRIGLSRYVMSYWALNAGPLLLAPLVSGFGGLLALHLIACVGGAGWPAMHGELLKRLYPDHRRGRMYAMVSAGSMLGGALASWLVGHLLSDDPWSFRWYMPAASGCMGLGAVLMVLVVRAAGADDGRTSEGAANVLRSVIDPIVHMRAILAADKVFARYEAAFMTYGVGWMVCYALVPLIATDKLKLSYDAVASSTHVAFLVAQVAATFPAGWLMDRLGATRTSAISFAVYVLYPIGLIAATNAGQLTAASVVYGVCAAGVSVGWMLGPVSLAPTPAKVPHYVAIHATMVGLRGTVFQGIGVGLYSLTGSFTLPLVMAALAFAWAAWQMWTLHRYTRKQERAAVDVEPEPETGGTTG